MRVRELEDRMLTVRIVYNVTTYARDHPGGAEALLEVAGLDATSAYEDVGHSEDAREIMHPFLVGSIDGAGDESTPAAIQPTVQVVRQSPGNQASKPKRLLSPTVELSIFSVGTAAVVYFIRHTDLAHPSMVHLSGLKQSGGSFTQGFLFASASAVAIAIASFRYLSSLLDFGVDFSKLPAHRASSERMVSSNHPAGVISPSTYRKFALREKTELSEGIWRFVFDLPTSTSVLGLPIGQHIAMRGQVGDHTISRSYTPVSNNRDRGRLELLIRIYPDGQLGKYLSTVGPGDQVEIRGPKGAMRYRKGMSTHLGMVGGGTGITPLFQLIRAICEDKTDDTKISLVFANRSLPDIMLKAKLDYYAKVASDKFKVTYLLDHPPASGWTGLTGYVTKDLLKSKMPAVAPTSKVLLCGPPGLVNATKNNLIELGFEAPGSVSKMVDQIFMF